MQGGLKSVKSITGLDLSLPTSTTIDPKLAAGTLKEALTGTI